MSKKRTAVAEIDADDEATPASRPEPAGPVRMTRLPAEVNAAVTFVAANQARLIDVAEKILAAYAPGIDATSPPDYRGVRLLFHADELTVFDALGWDGERLRRELSRVRNIVDLQRAAGTSAERQAAAEKLAAAKLAHETRGPAIVEELVRLEREKDSLEHAVKVATNDVHQRQRAVELLEEKLPQHIHEQFRRERSQVRHEFREPFDFATEQLREARKQPDSPENTLAISKLEAKLKKLEAEREAAFAEVRRKHLSAYAR